MSLRVVDGSGGGAKSSTPTYIKQFLDHVNEILLSPETVQAFLVSTNKDGEIETAVLDTRWSNTRIVGTLEYAKVSVITAVQEEEDDA